MNSFSRLTLAGVLALNLTSCSLLNSAGGLLNGMLQALGRTAGALTEAETPGAHSGPDAISTRGAEIAGRGIYRGPAGLENAIVPSHVASR